MFGSVFHKISSAVGGVTGLALGPMGALGGGALYSRLMGLRKGSKVKQPTTPTPNDPAVLAAQEEERRRSQRGYGSTIRTGGQGLLTSPSLASRALFG